MASNWFCALCPPHTMHFDGLHAHSLLPRGEGAMGGNSIRRRWNFALQDLSADCQQEEYRIRSDWLSIVSSPNSPICGDSEGTLMRIFKSAFNNLIGFVFQSRMQYDAFFSNFMPGKCCIYASIWCPNRQRRQNFKATYRNITFFRYFFTEKVRRSTRTYPSTTHWSLFASYFIIDCNFAPSVLCILTKYCLPDMCPALFDSSSNGWENQIFLNSTSKREWNEFSMNATRWQHGIHLLHST